MSDSNGNGNGNISTRTVLTVCLGLLQAGVFAAGGLLYTTIQSTNEGLNKIKDSVTQIQLDTNEELSDIKASIRILESKNPKP